MFTSSYSANRLHPKEKNLVMIPLIFLQFIKLRGTHMHHAYDTRNLGSDVIVTPIAHI